MKEFPIGDKHFFTGEENRRIGETAKKMAEVIKEQKLTFAEANDALRVCKVLLGGAEVGPWR